MPLPQRQQLSHSARPNSEGELPPNWLKIFTRTPKQLENLYAQHRRQLLDFETEQTKTYRRLGLAPYLELAE